MSSHMRNHVTNYSIIWKQQFRKNNILKQLQCNVFWHIYLLRTPTLQKQRWITFISNYSTFLVYIKEEPILRTMNNRNTIITFKTV